MRRKLILILTFPLTLVVVGMAFNSISIYVFDWYEPKWGRWYSFKLGTEILFVMGLGSFVSHMPIALILDKRLPANRPWMMILLSLAAMGTTLLLMPLREFFPLSLESILLFAVLLPGLVMSLIYVLVAFVPCCFLNRSNPPNTI